VETVSNHYCGFLNFDSVALGLRDAFQNQIGINFWSASVHFGCDYHAFFARLERAVGLWNFSGHLGRASQEGYLPFKRAAGSGLGDLFPHYPAAL
jgi:hypothetical protein